MKRRRFLQALALAPLAPKLAVLPPPAVAAPAPALVVYPQTVEIPLRRTNFASLTPEQAQVWSRDLWLAYRANVPAVPKAARKARRR